VHALVHAMHPEDGAAMTAVSRGEYGAQYEQTGQRECPESEVFSEGPEGAFRAGGQEENKVAGDGERGSRQQRQEVDHRSTRRGSGGFDLTPGPTAQCAN
jgi:hypothetical protein